MSTPVPAPAAATAAGPLVRAEAGFAALAVPESARASALANLERWLSDPIFISYRPQLTALIDAGRWAMLLDSFYQVLPFGTGGRRGSVGVGPNRFNPWTLGASVQGHAAWMHRTMGDGPLSVVITYDVREFRDARKQLLAEAASPVMGLSSRAFAEIAAEVYAAADITVHMPPVGEYLSTPELSFAIRQLGASAGLMVSASHNPPDDNGGKFYNAEGGQEVPPSDEEMAKEVDNVGSIQRMSLDRARAAGLVLAVGPEVHQGYLDTNLACSLTPTARSARIVFTGLHGLGRQTVAELLELAGFDVHLEPTQAPYDGAFTNVPFRAPNPEVPRSMEAACRYADQISAHVVMSCDPDADRLGLMVRHPAQPGGTWRFITGNEIAALACKYVVAAGGRSHPLVVQTEVTSSLVSRTARAGGARVISHLLVGFKYIGDVLHQLETRGEFADVRARLEDFALGAEESHGLLVTPALRDKDAAGGALLLAELASLELDRGRTLVDTLEDLWRQVGYVKNLLRSTVMLGAEGRARIARIMDSFRHHPPATIGGRPVTAFRDRQDPTGIFGPHKSGTDTASRNVLVFELGDDARIILRPSGTEPKAKFYVEVVGHPGTEAGPDTDRIDAQAGQLADAFGQLMLDSVGLALPTWAFRINDLVAIEHKLRFAQVVLPGLVERLDPQLAQPQSDPANPPDARPASVDAERWLDQQLVPFGRDARKLVAPAVRAWVRLERPSCGTAILALFSD